LWSTLRERPVILVLTLAGVLLVYSSAASQHTITWLVAERGFDYARAAFAAAAVTLVGGLAGNVAIGAITDRARRAHRAGRLLALAGVSAFGLAAALAFYSAPPGSWRFVACWLVAQAFLLGWYGSLVAAVDEHAPDGRHASVIGFLLLAVNLLGVASGPYVTGLVGDRLDLTRALQGSLAPGLAGALLVALVGFFQWPARPSANGA
jgi:MFS family permease